ncbi:MAG TPA: aldehyde dehydrogenase family protein [Thermomicrobiales bacterium]|nr:aldehyde dehydrogenase family protein [Thermomicrobiales bacterium]
MATTVKEAPRGAAADVKRYPIYLAGEWATSDKPLEIVNPYDASVIGVTYDASQEQLEQAIVAAQQAFETTSKMPTYDRVALLEALARGLKARRDEFIRMVALEAGKPVRDATAEVDRGVFTLQTAAEEAKRIEGEVIPLDLLASSKGRFGIVRRFPIGPIAGISPFNYPLNLALHKIAPAIAAGNTIVLKPPSRDPLTMLLFAELIEEAGVPKGAVSILPMNREVGDALVADDRFKLLSFTGSPEIGWKMKARAGMKPVVLELGGNAGVIVDEDSDLDFAVGRVKVGAFSYAGQVCISVQRVFVHEKVYDAFRDKLVAAVKTIKMGDPLDPATELGPMIDDKAALRSQAWIEQAAADGARVLTGGKAEGRFFPPTVIENAKQESFVCSREAFAPLVTIFPIASFGEGIRRVNDSEFGLQAGVFTNSLERSLAAFESIEAGAVIINDIPTYRIDHMPYGGVKASGLSREGLRYAIEDMTEPRLMVFNRLASQAVKID